MIKEMYNPLVIGVDAVVNLDSTIIGIGGFLAKTSGTLTVVNSRGVTIVDAVPVTAGVYTPMPFSLRSEGDYGTPATRTVITTAGGASGTLGF